MQGKEGPYLTKLATFYGNGNPTLKLNPSLQSVHESVNGNICNTNCGNTSDPQSNHAMPWTFQLGRNWAVNRTTKHAVLGDLSADALFLS